MVASDPELAQPAPALNGRARTGDAERVHLALSLADLDAERVLLQAASANAAIQLGAGRLHPGAPAHKALPPVLRPHRAGPS